jgi:hypothetical protein
MVKKMFIVARLKNEPSDEVKFGLTENTGDTNAKLYVINADDTKNETTPVLTGTVGILEHYSGGTFQQSDNKIIPTNVPGCTGICTTWSDHCCWFWFRSSKSESYRIYPNNCLIMHRMNMSL